MSVSDRTERRRELLCERALHGLPPGEERELSTLRHQSPSIDEDSYERAAAALHLALLSKSIEPLPGRLRDRLAREANTRIGGGGRATRQED